MFDPNVFKKHRNWEDWLAMSLGVAIWATTKAVAAESPLIHWNTTLVGVVVLILATAINDKHARGREAAEAACGIWLMLSPLVFGYASSGYLRYWHVGLGAAVALLAALELLQDWNESSE